MIGGAQEKLFGGLIVLVNRPAVGAAQLDRVGDDARQHGFQIESRAHRLADFAERFQFADRTCQFVGSLIQFFEQPHVLDGDDGLGGKGFEKFDLLLGERADLHAADMNRPDRNSLAQQRRGKHRPNTETSGVASLEGHPLAMLPGS